MKNSIIVLLFSLFTLSNTSVMSQTKMKSGSISIFKNGTYFTFQQGNAKVNNKTLSLIVPNNPLYGTIWMGVGKENKIEYISVKEDTVKTKHTAKSMIELLKANKNKLAKIHFNVGGNDPIKTMAGEIDAIYLETNTLVLKNGEKISMCNLNSIIQVDIENGANSQYELDSMARIAKVYLEKPVSEIPVNMIYMQNGINWIPSYILKIVDDKNAKLEMKATLENTVESINNCEVNLVVGNPQMYYGSQIDPIALGFNPNVYAGYAQPMQYYSNAAPSMKESRMESADAAVVYNQEYSTEGEKEQDLYYYRLGKLNLEKNAKVLVPISMNNITYKDVYEVDIYDYTQYFNNRTCYPDPNRKFDVYHKLKFDNTSGNPLTTASIFVVNENEEPLAQDQIEYTPTNAEAEVKLSKAIDVLIKSEEEEKDRVDNSKKINKVNYTKVIIKGEVEVANYQEKKIKITAKKSVNGEVTNASDDGKIIKQKVTYYGYVNPNSMVTWELELNAGEKKKVTYEYEVYVSM